MAVHFVTRKCTQCAGRLEYIREKKLWRCLYCGAEVERQEEYDGLFTIKNVVRQTLLDAAQRRLRDAQTNLLECEKIDSRYIGTLIARITFQMIRISTPGACSAQEARTLMTQLQQNAARLRGGGSAPSEEEEALYEFLDQADILATLALVFDSLGEGTRRDYVLALLDVQEVTSAEVSGNLLSYALQNNALELADSVLARPNQLHVGAALATLLQSYPDGAAKAEHAARLLAAQPHAAEERRGIEAYLTSSGDAAHTRAAVTAAAVSAGIPVDLRLTVERLLPGAEREDVLAVLAAYCSRKLDDASVLRILKYACACQDARTASGALDCLREGNQYVSVPSEAVIPMLSSSGLSAQEKTGLLEQLFSFQMDARSAGAVVANYLCFNQDPVSDRKAVLACLLRHTGAPATSTVENYVLRCTADGAEKPAILQMLFDAGLRTSFFAGLLSKYMNAAPDGLEVRAAVAELLSSHGLKMDPSGLIRYLCSPQDSAEAKLQFLRTTSEGGAALRSDTAGAYLERVSPDDFSPELFSALVTPASWFGPGALERYLLRVRDRDGQKAGRLRVIAGHCSGAADCQIEHAGDSLSCNLLQAYVLLSPDSLDITRGIVQWLISEQRMKLNAPLRVSGREMRFRKYITANRSRLTATAEAICQEHRAFSLFF